MYTKIMIGLVICLADYIHSSTPYIKAAFLPIENDKLVLPKCVFDNSKKLIENVKGLAKTIVDLDLNWLDFTLIGVYQADEELQIIYSVFIPNENHISSSIQWVTYEQLQQFTEKFSRNDIKAYRAATSK